MKRKGNNGNDRSEAEKMSDNVHCGREAHNDASDREDTAGELAGRYAGYFGGAYGGEVMRDLNGNEIVDHVAVCVMCLDALKAATESADVQLHRELHHEVVDELALVDGQVEPTARPCLLCACTGRNLRRGRPPHTTTRVARAVVERALSRHGESVGFMAPGPVPDGDGGTEAGAGEGPGHAASAGGAWPAREEPAEPSARLAAPVRGPWPAGADWLLIVAVVERAAQRADWVRLAARDAAEQGTGEALGLVSRELEALQRVLDAARLIVRTEGAAQLEAEERAGGVR